MSNWTGNGNVVFKAKFDENCTVKFDNKCEKCFWEQTFRKIQCTLYKKCNMSNQTVLWKHQTV